MTDTVSVLIVEDEADMARVLEFNLSEHGYSTRVAACGREAIAKAQTEPPELMLLDLRLPDISGLEVLRALKAEARTEGIAVLIVSAIGNEESVVQTLNLGAEDYVVKPVRTQELVARVAAVLRRVRKGAVSATVLRLGEIALDTETRAARAGDRELDLTRSEFDLLAYLLRHPGRVFTREQLCGQALGAAGSVQERTVDAHVRTIRRKLGDAGRHLTTVWGIGYRVAEDAP